MNEQTLHKEDVDKLMSLLHNVSDSWYDIGLGLGFAPSELISIRGNQSMLMSAPASYLKELLSQWVQWPTMNHPTRPTLGALCEALRSPYVGLFGSLAAEKVQTEMKYSTPGIKGVVRKMSKRRILASITTMCH